MRPAPGSNRMEIAVHPYIHESISPLILPIVGPTNSLTSLDWILSLADRGLNELAFIGGHWRQLRLNGIS